jgi:hypothetical protein
MVNRSDSFSLPPAIRRAASGFRIAGWVSFWAQVVLGVVSAIALSFAALNLGAPPPPQVPGANPAATNNNSIIGIGLFFAVFGLLALLAGAFWAFRYTRLSQRLRSSDSQLRPKRGEALQALRIGLLINLAGMLGTILGAQAIVGALAARSMAQGFASIVGSLPAYISPLQILAVQANTNTILAHFIGLIATLWLIQQMNRQ